MKPVCLLIANFLLPFAISNPVSYESFTEITDAWTNIAGGAQTNCRNVGGYDSTNKVFKIYGGQDNPRAKYIFDPAVNKYTFVNLTHGLDADLTEIGETVQKKGENIIYFAVGDFIEGIDLATDERAVYANLSDNTFTDPGLCFDQNSGDLYVVGGTQKLQKCPSGALSSSSPGECTEIAQSNLPDQFKTSTCSVYMGTLYIFGGAKDGEIVSETVFKCEYPENVDNCTELTVNTDGGKYGIFSGMRSVFLDCFMGKYVVLLGGQDGGATPTSNVEIFNLKTETYVNISNGLTPTMADARRQFLALLDPETEEIYAFGGVQNNANTCRNRVERTTNSHGMGLCVTTNPTMDPTSNPTVNPSANPSKNPTLDPTTNAPTTSPTMRPTRPEPAVYEPDPDTYGIAVGPYVVIFILLAAVCCIFIICGWWYDRNVKDKKYGMSQSLVNGGGAAGAGGTVAMAGVATDPQYGDKKYEDKK